MKNFIFLLIMSISIATSSTVVNAQDNSLASKHAMEEGGTPHKIIFQMASGDTLVHKQLMKQLNNILAVAPSTKMEVVCHGPGLDMLITDKTIIADKVKKLIAAGVVFNACEFSMKDKNIVRNQILAEAGTVPAGILEIVARQEQGWSYIKSGF